MKHIKPILFALFLTAVFSSVQAQDVESTGPYQSATEAKGDSAFTKVDIPSRFPGGDSAWMNFVQDNFSYPARCIEEGISGYVLLRFVVDKTGRISNIQAIEETRSCPEFTEEAVRLLMKSPRWIPAQVNGKFVRSWRVIPIKLSVE